MDKEKPIIALDFPNTQLVYQFLQKLDTKHVNLKIGMELFYAGGATLVTDLIAQGYDVFLDLKLHDIPNTVSRTARVISQLGCKMINVHALGGYKMMKDTVEAVNDLPNKPLLIAVTQLTSSSQEQLQQEQLTSSSVIDSVVHLAKLAQQAGMDGVVCSPQEVPYIKQACGDEFLTVTPGIRQQRLNSDDQVRTTTAKQARTIGSDYIVVGRPITQALDVKHAYETILNEWSDANE